MKPGECRSQQLVIVVRAGVLGGMRRIVHVVLEIGWIGRVRRSAGLAKKIRGTAPGEMVHPRREAAIIPIRVAVFQHTLEHRLQDVLGGGAVSR